MKINSNFRKLTGLKAADVIGKSSKDILKIDMKLRFDIIDKVIKTDKSCRY